MAGFIDMSILRVHNIDSLYGVYRSFIIKTVIMVQINVTVSTNVNMFRSNTVNVIIVLNKMVLGCSNNNFFLFLFIKGECW